MISLKLDDLVNIILIQKTEYSINIESESCSHQNGRLFAINTEKIKEFLGMNNGNNGIWNSWDTNFYQQ